MAFSRELSRRDFLKLSAGSTAALGMALYQFPNFEQLLAASAKYTPVIWIHGGACSGCSVSLLDAASPKVQDVIVSEVIPGNQLSIRFHQTIMAGQGDIAMQALEDTAKNKGGYVLVVEGSISTKDDGVYCEVGEKDGHGIPILEHVKTLGRDAMAVIAIGSCAAFGGIPAAEGNKTGSTSVRKVFAQEGIQTPLINLPGCPCHPDWFIGTVASILIGGLDSVEVDDLGRPLAFYGKLIHDNCPRRGYYDAGKFAKTYSEPYCLFELGCKGTVTYSDCPIRQRNGRTNWCVGSNSPCIGCCHPGFPDAVSPFKEVTSAYSVEPPVWLPPIDEPQEEPEGFNPGLAAGLGVAGGIVAGAAVTAALKKSNQEDGEDEE